MKPLLFIAAWISFALGLLGVFLPLLPTTPLILLSAFLFSKSSDRWHQWLIENKRFGPMILDWQERGVISRKSKITASILILVALSFSLLEGGFNLWIKLGLVVVLFLVVLYICTRPEE